MVDALREARRTLKSCGVLIDVRPVTLPMVVEVVVGSRAIWAKEIDAYSAPDDVAAADAAVQHALSVEWFTFEKRLPYHLEIYCDTAGDLSIYAQSRKLLGAQIPYQELEERRSEMGTRGQPARLRCRRPWMLSAYRKR